MALTGGTQSSGADLAALLHENQATVTAFLERLAGEPIDADVVFQHPAPADDDDRLELEPNDEVLRRAVLLTGRETGRRFVYAESTIAVGRLPGAVRRRLELSQDPIGKVLTDHHLPIRREPLSDPGAPHGVGREVLGLVRASALSRRYRIVVVDAPAIVVSEWFLPSVPHALDARPRLDFQAG